MKLYLIIDEYCNKALTRSALLNPSDCFYNEWNLQSFGNEMATAFSSRRNLEAVRSSGQKEDIYNPCILGAKDIFSDSIVKNKKIYESWNNLVQQC